MIGTTAAIITIVLLHTILLKVDATLGIVRYEMSYVSRDAKDDNATTIMRITETRWNESDVATLGELCRDISAYNAEQNALVVREWTCHSSDGIHVCARGCSTSPRTMSLASTINVEYYLSPRGAKKIDVDMDTMTQTQTQTPPTIPPVLACTSLPAAACLVVYPMHALFLGRAKRARDLVYKRGETFTSNTIQVHWSSDGQWAYLFGRGSINARDHVVVFSHRSRRLVGIAWTAGSPDTRIMHIVPFYGTTDPSLVDSDTDPAVDTDTNNDDTISKETNPVTQRASGVVFAGVHALTLTVCIGIKCTDAAETMFGNTDLGDITTLCITDLAAPVLARGVVVVVLDTSAVVIGVYDITTSKFVRSRRLVAAAAPGYVDCSGRLACVYYACQSDTVSNLDFDSVHFGHTRPRIETVAYDAATGISGDNPISEIVGALSGFISKSGSATATGTVTGRERVNCHGTSGALAVGIGRYAVSEIVSSETPVALRRIEMVDTLGMADADWRVYHPVFVSGTLETDGSASFVRALDMTLLTDRIEPVYVLGTIGDGVSLHTYDSDADADASNTHIAWRGYEPVPVLSLWRNSTRVRTHARFSDFRAFDTTLADVVTMPRAYRRDPIRVPWDEREWHNQTDELYKHAAHDAEIEFDDLLHTNQRRYKHNHKHRATHSSNNRRAGNNTDDDLARIIIIPRTRNATPAIGVWYRPVAQTVPCIGKKRHLVTDSCGTCGGDSRACMHYACHVVGRNNSGNTGTNTAYRRMTAHPLFIYTFTAFPSLLFETLGEAIRVCGASHSEIHVWPDTISETLSDIVINAIGPVHTQNTGASLAIIGHGHTNGNGNGNGNGNDTERAYTILYGAFHVIRATGRGLIFDSIEFHIDRAAVAFSNVPRSLPPSARHPAAFVSLTTSECVEFTDVTVRIDIGHADALAAGTHIVSFDTGMCNGQSVIFDRVQVSFGVVYTDPRHVSPMGIRAPVAAMYMDVPGHVSGTAIECIDVRDRTCIYIHTRGGDVALTNITGTNCGTFAAACVNATASGNPSILARHLSRSTMTATAEQQITVVTGTFDGDSPLGIAIRGFHHVNVNGITHRYVHPSQTAVGAGILVTIVTEDDGGSGDSANDLHETLARALARQLYFANRETPVIRISTVYESWADMKVPHVRLAGQQHHAVLEPRYPNPNPNPGTVTAPPLSIETRTHVTACIRGCGTNVRVRLFHDALYYNEYMHDRRESKHQFTEHSIIYGTMEITGLDPANVARGRYELVLLNAEWCTEFGTPTGAPPQYDPARAKYTGCHSYNTLYGLAGAREVVRTKKLYSYTDNDADHMAKNIADRLASGMRPTEMSMTVIPGTTDATMHKLHFQVKAGTIVTADHKYGLLMFAYDVIDREMMHTSVPMSAYTSQQINPDTTNPSQITSVYIQTTCDIEHGYFRNTAPHQAKPFSQGVCTPWHFEADAGTGTPTSIRTGIHILFFGLVTGIVVLSVVFAWMQYTSKHAGTQWHAAKRKHDNALASFREIDATWTKND